MEKITLNAQLREKYGKGGCKKLRKDGLIPCVVYKEGKATVNIQVDSKDLWHAVHSKAGENAIITMNIDGEAKQQKTVIVREIQHDPLNDKFVHVDFHEISLKEKIKVKPAVSYMTQAEIEEFLRRRRRRDRITSPFTMTKRRIII